MDEVDNIIIHSLRQIGCDVEEDVQSLKDFTTELVVEAAAKCLRLINPALTVPSRLPPGMSARYRLGTTLAESCVELGYKGDIGYQTFLYSNESEVRKLLMFLIEKLPKESAETSDTPAGASVLLERAVAREITRLLQSPWLPPLRSARGLWWRDYQQNRWRGKGKAEMRPFRTAPINIPDGVIDLLQDDCIERLEPSVFESHALELAMEQEWETEWSKYGLPSRLTPEEYRARKRERLQSRIREQLSKVVSEDDGEAILPSAPSRESQTLLVKASRFAQEEKYKSTEGDAATVTPARIDSEQDQVNKREEEEAELRKKVEEIAEQLEKLKTETKQYSSNIKQMEEELTNYEEENAELETTYKMKKRVFDLLPDADNNIAKLKELVEVSSKRLAILAEQWEQHRIPLEEKYQQLKDASENKVTDSQRMLEEIKQLREKMREDATLIKDKDEYYKQLVGEYERTPKDVNRAAYTKRIMEIISNINKQNCDIQKVLQDTKGVQKEINHMSGKLDRTFTVTDELIFRDAKKDETIRKAYKYLAALHENCNLLIKTVEDTGGILREIRDLEDQLESESNKKIVANLERIMADYQQMKKENSTLLSQLKQQN